MTVVEDYLQKLDPPERKALERIRQIIREVAPEAQEVMTYGMPGFKYNGKYFVSFAAFKDHLSLFPGAEPVEFLKDRLKGYKLSKGTIQFTLEQPLPDSLIKEILDICIARNKRSKKGY